MSLPVVGDGLDPGDFVAGLSVDDVSVGASVASGISLSSEHDFLRVSELEASSTEHCWRT